MLLQPPCGPCALLGSVLFLQPAVTVFFPPTPPSDLEGLSSVKPHAAKLGMLWAGPYTITSRTLCQMMHFPTVYEASVAEQPTALGTAWIDS